MKSVIGIFGVALLCMLLGLSIGWGKEAGISLVSAEPSALFGISYGS